MARRFVLRADEAPPAPPSALLDALARELGPDQLAAATAGAGPTLVVAGAGTGKTRTLVYRLAYLLGTGTPAADTALLTFTRRAAREMTARAEGLVVVGAGAVRGGTFHALGLTILRRYARLVGYPEGFTVLDASDAADVVDLLRTEAGLDRAGLRFPKKRSIQTLFSAALNRGLPLADVLDAEAPAFRPHLDALESLRDSFEVFKRRNGLADYDDLLALPRDLLRENDRARRAVAGACRHVLVDEYQDVNGVQADLVALLASVHGNVTAVGDDAQSIYGFRGADVAHILGFPARYPGARVFRLEENYRSTQPILDLANHVLAGASQGYSKRLRTRREGGELPALVQAPDDAWQSRFVCQVVLDSREAGVPLARQAVLFRSAWCSYALEAELTRRGVPFVKVGGLKLAEAAHIKDLVAHLRVAENPADAVAWNRALRLVDGVGPKTARALLDVLTQASGAGTERAEASTSRAEASGGRPEVSALEGPEGWAEGPGLSQEGAEASGAERGGSGGLGEEPGGLGGGHEGSPAPDPLAALGAQTSGRFVAGLQALAALIADLRREDVPLAVQTERLLAYYRPAFERVYAEDWASREADLEGFAALAARFARRRELLEALALDPLDKTTDGVEAAYADEAPLVLSTIHSAKGLEFDTVFLIEALDGVLPTPYAVKSPEELDEERRLLYVALTRAERELFVCYPLTQRARGAGGHLTRVTRFLAGVPEALLEPVHLVEERPAPAGLALPPGAAGALPPAEG